METVGFANDRKNFLENHYPLFNIGHKKGPITSQLLSVESAVFRNNLDGNHQFAASILRKYDQLQRGQFPPRSETFCNPNPNKYSRLLTAEVIESILLLCCLYLKRM